MLSASRLSNQVVLLFSPLLLVRMLEVEQYGQYREFVLYAMLLKVVIAFSASKSLLYFLPMRPEHERGLVTQNVLFTFLFCLLGTGLILLCGDVLRAHTSFDFVLPLVVYLFFFINLDFLEYYWLAKKRSDFVLYYSTGRVLIRLAAVVLAAYYSGDPLVIAYALTAVEVLRFLFALYYAWRRDLLTGRVSWTACKEQLSYFAPLGMADVTFQLNQNLSRLFVSSTLGVVALSYYVIGSYVMPLVAVVRGSVADVIFPEMVDKRIQEPQQRLELWQRATLLYCLLLFPLAALGVFYSSEVVVILFTADYAAAAPIFAIYSLMLAQDAFDLGLPIRALGKTKVFVYSSVAALLLNAVLLYPMYLQFGLIGPALTYFVARLMVSFIFGAVVLRLYRMRVGALLEWETVGRIATATAAGIGVLLLLRTLGLPAPLEVVTGTFLFLVTYALVLHRLRNDSIELFLGRFLPLFMRMPVLRRFRRAT